MNTLLGKYAMTFLYVLGGIFLFWSVFTFLYQFIAAVGSWEGVLSSWQDTRIISALWLSILSSFVTVFVAIAFGVPLAYVFAVKHFRGKALLETMAVDVPQTFPPVAEGIIYYFMLGPHSPIGWNLAYTFTALVIAKVYVCAPFVIANVARQFRNIQQTGFDMTARSLGASSWQNFIWIFIPMSLKNIAAGASLCWARAMGELGGSLIFAGVIAYKTEIIPTFIATQASIQSVAALAASIIVTVSSALALITFKQLTRH